MPIIEKFKNAKTRNKILIILGLLILLFILGYLIYILTLKYFQPPAAPAPENVNQAALPSPAAVNFNAEVSTNYIANESIASEKAKMQKEGTALLVAASFAERFGSFSNQDNYQNFADLEIFMADPVKKWVNNYADQLRKDHPEFAEYYGMETKVISSEVKSIDEIAGKAEITLTTQRSEFTSPGASPRVFYQDVLMKMVKANNNWLVEGIYWQ
jgi:hypothetical protein